MELSQTKINNKNNLMNNTLDTSSIQEALRSIETIREQYINSMQVVSKTLESIRNPYIESMRDSYIESMRDPYIESIKSVSKNLESIKAPYIDSIQELRKTIEKMTKLYNSSALQTSLSQLSKTINLNNGLTVDFEDEVEIDVNYSQVVDNEEIVSYVNEVNEILQDESISIIEKIQKLLKKICILYKELEQFFGEHPIMYDITKLVLKKLLPILILISSTMFYLLNILSANSYNKFISISHSITENYSSYNKSFNKSIKKEVSKELSTIKEADRNYLLNTYRFVNCESLNVRTSNTMKSSSIYKLTQGSVVRIINKQKNWTKIEYKNEDETVIIIGWVNTRYISRFK